MPKMEVLTTKRNEFKVPTAEDIRIAAVLDKYDFDPELKFVVAPEDQKKFGEAEKKLVLGVIGEAGADVRAVKTIEYREAKNQSEADNLGTWYPDEGRLVVWKSCLQTSPEAVKTLVHELMHSNSVLYLRRSDIWKNDSVREDIDMQLGVFAMQTLDTKNYLSGYHRFLCEKYIAGKMDFELLKEETQAILYELAIANPKKLLTVAFNQKKDHKKCKSDFEHIDAMDIAVSIISGMKKTGCQYGNRTQVEEFLTERRAGINAVIQDYKIENNQHLSEIDSDPDGLIMNSFQMGPPDIKGALELAKAFSGKGNPDLEAILKAANNVMLFNKQVTPRKLNPMLDAMVWGESDVPSSVNLTAVRRLEEVLGNKERELDFEAILAALAQEKVLV